MPGNVGPDDLYELATDVLAAAVASLDTLLTAEDSDGNPLDLAGAPERSFVSVDPPVWDCCDMLVVSAPLITREFTSPSSPAKRKIENRKSGRGVLLRPSGVGGRGRPRSLRRDSRAREIPPRPWVWSPFWGLGT